MQVTIYSTTTCPYCKMLKSYLNEKNISYVEKYVDQNESAREEMMAKSGGYLGVPFILVIKNGENTPIIGFDRNRVNKVFNIQE